MALTTGADLFGLHGKSLTIADISVAIADLMDASSALVCAAVADSESNTSEDTVSSVVGRFVGAKVGLDVGTPHPEDPAAACLPVGQSAQEVAWAPPGEYVFAGQVSQEELLAT